MSSPKQTSETYPTVDDLRQEDLEAALLKAHAEAKKRAWQSNTADPDTMLAILAMYAIQEVHALGFVCSCLVEVRERSTDQE